MIKCSRCYKDKDDIEFVRYAELHKTCNSCNDDRRGRYQRNKEGIFSKKQLLSVRRDQAFKNGNFVCCRCGEEKPLDNFTPDKTGRSKFNKIGFCNSCRSESYKFSKIKSQHGLSREDFLEIMEEQKGKCRICDITMETFNQGSNKANTLCIDHCHETGKFRGFICNNCNRAIGLLKDDEEVLLSAYRYVAQFKSDELLEKPEEVNQQPSLELNAL